MSPDRANGTEAFDPAVMPLDGIRLVEASAGTGKTFSLAGLYLRLVVERHLDVRDILVMTFTRAATQELRERLRERLALAARVATETPDDARDEAAERFAETVIAAADEPREAVARRLRDAATRVDQATITTIHGFAQRAAGENAFESTLPFDRGEQVDDGEIQREAATDYWRARVFDRPAAQAAAFLGLWSSPDALYRDLREVLGKPHARLVRPDAATLDHEHEQARQQWPREREAFVKLLSKAAEAGALLANSSLKKLLDEHDPESLAESIDAGLEGTLDGLPALPGFVADLGSDTGVRQHAKKKEAEDWFRPQDLAAVKTLARLQVRGRIAAAAAAVDAIRELAATRKRERRLFSFNDMIAGLHDAVTDATRGPALAAALRRTWPWALVDEFQDTDPLQYAILQRIYGHGGGERDESAGGLILIGDPKQAIYGFRGGDVFAYLDAADDADGRYGMETNFRSTGAVLQGLESVFAAGGEQAFVLDGIDFRHVDPGRRDGDRRIERKGQELPGVTAWSVPDDAESAKTKLKPRIESATVERIVALLDQARVIDDEDGQRPLEPRDIAVLVNSNAEAADMQAALAGAGVPAVCIHQDSVFTHVAAQDLLRLLRAVATPFDAGRLRVALTTPLFGLQLADLVALDADERRWADWTERFQAAHVRWARSGVQAMLEPFLQDAAARVVALTDGERRMTDYLQVADRLQQVEHEVFGMDGLVRWLEDAMQRAGDGEVGDADRVRLADDADLVQVTTVHKAKGLQFPVVFVPYTPWLGTGGAAPGKPPLSYHDADNLAVIDLGSEDADAHAGQAIRERRAEQVRSLYVALTRAEQACFFVHGAVNGALDGPLAWLLHRDDGIASHGWHGGRKLPDWFTPARAAERLRTLEEAVGSALTVEDLPDPQRPAHLSRTATGPALGPARNDFPKRRRPWSISSFSRLAGRMTGAAETAAGADDESDTITRESIEPGSTPEIALWPRGTGFGRAFHELLETGALEHWPRPGAEPLDTDTHATASTALRRHGVGTTDADGSDGPITRTATMLAHTLHTALPEIGPLSAIGGDRRRAELEFFIRLGDTNASDVLARIAAAGYAGAGGSTALSSLRGLMHGYIDLVVEHSGRYWILDYKTNALGPHLADYAPGALARAMVEHRYDLQYLLYSVALHRHLGQHLADYRADAHLGGVLYLFARGMNGDGEHGIFHDRPDPGLVESLDALLDAREAPA